MANTILLEANEGIRIHLRLRGSAKILI